MEDPAAHDDHATLAQALMLSLLDAPRETKPPALAKPGLRPEEPVDDEGLMEERPMWPSYQEALAAEAARTAQDPPSSFSETRASRAPPVAGSRDSLSRPPSAEPIPPQPGPPAPTGPGAPGESLAASPAESMAQQVKERKRPP